MSAGFNEMIGNLHSLRRDEAEDDDQSTTVTETSSLDEERAGTTQESELRLRK